MHTYCLHVCVCMHAHMHAHMHARMYACMKHIIYTFHTHCIHLAARG